MNELKALRVERELNSLIGFVMVNRRRQRNLYPLPPRRFAVELQSLDQIETGLHGDRLSHRWPAGRGPGRGDEDILRRQRSGYDRVDAASAQCYEMAEIIS